MKFISSKNAYEFDSINFKDNLIALYIESQYCIFRYKGSVEFFKDGNGVGEIWIDFSHDITTELVHELSDENITLLNFHEEYVVEWIAEQIYLDKEKGDFDNSFDTVFKQFKDNTKPMCELMGCPELAEDFIVDVEINRQSFKSFYEAGQQSLQAEIDNLKKRIDDAVALLEYNEYVDSPLQALEVLKGDT